jgi:DsbC/DsbD-like thiol-disulfide interchange protein
MRFWFGTLWLAALVVAGSFPGLTKDKQPANWPGLEGNGWVVTGPAAVRLISSHQGFRPGAASSLGVQVKLRPGWWTYWRAPGDMGMPPDFNWSGSQNLKWTPELFWPKPLQRTSFGHALRVYRDEVVFPLRVVAADPAKPLKLNLNMTFGVCKEVCIPNVADVVLELPPGQGALPAPIPDNLELIRRFQAEVPTANVQRAGFRIQKVGLQRGASGQDFLAVELARAARQAQPLVLIELSPGESPLIAQSLGRESSTGVWRFAASLDPDQGQEPSLVGRRVRVTIFDGGRSLEQIWVVGASADSSGRFGRAAAGGQIADPSKPIEETWKPRD